MASIKEWVLLHEDLVKILHYDPESGVWTWQMDVAQSVRAGDVAGCINPRGYNQIRINGMGYRAARLAFFYMNGQWPAGQMDHRNGQAADDRWENLREATPKQNCRNRGRFKSNTSGSPGVTWSRRAKKYRAQIQTDGKYQYLGYFDTPEAASAAYETAAKEQFGEFYPNKLN